MRSGPAPRLSICIPTHHGRAATLDHLLTEIGRQLEGLGDEVEVCVSDNASADDTPAVLERHRDAALGGRLRTRRNDHDLRLRNIACATDLASGRYCWLFGSDDAPAPGAVRAVLHLLDDYPDAAGFALGIRRMEPGMAAPADLIGAEVFPAERRTTAYTTPTGIAQALGWLHIPLSMSVVRRDLWQAVIREDPGLFDRYPDFPQTYALGRVVQRRPLWIWCPRLLVDLRSPLAYLDEPGELGPRLAPKLQLFNRQLSRVWADLHGRRSETYRALLHRWYRISAGPSAIHAVKVHDDHTWSDDLRLLSAAPAFWWSREFRRASLRWLLLPHGAFQSGPRLRRALGGGEPLAAAACRTTVALDPPPPFTTGYQSLVPCTVENRGPASLSSRLPHPVGLAARWFDAQGRCIAAGPRTMLLPSLRSGEARRIEIRVDPPFAPGSYELRITPVQELVAWFDDLDPANGWAGPVTVTPPCSVS